MTEAIRVEWFFGRVDYHAEILSKMANATGLTVVEEFNGDDLIAKPGCDAESVRAEWMDRRNARQASGA